jgi:hypothetical protein
MDIIESSESWLGDFFAELPLDMEMGLPADLFAGQPIIGDTGDAGGDWMPQTTDFTCAVVSQQMILDQFGLDVSEQELMYIGLENGWLTNGGTSPDDMGRLLEYHGIGTHANEGGGVLSLLEELRLGHKVIVGVDSGELWNQDSFWQDFVQPNGADHAVVVTGLDLRDPENPLVYINDPGDPNGAARPYPLEKFADAWNDSGEYYVATDTPPSNLGSDPIFGPNFLTGPDGIGQYLNTEWWTDLFSKYGPRLGFALGEGLVTSAARHGLDAVIGRDKEALLRSI